MRLKKLTISGFKSFASKTTLYFDLPLIGIVGPNGCGKSNIVDAFRWVIGEQSARSLRGERMEDLLFAGSSNAKPSNIAEVSVTFTDIEGDIPLDYEEVTITRRYYRDGESEYLINNQPVRLKSIHQLLLGSGVGKNAFSIFEQGKLDAVISYSPLERRAILDEVSGTSRFLVKKKESLKKLEEVDLNLSRVKDIYEEVKAKARILAKQAQVAKNYRESQTRLALLQKIVLARRFRSISLKEEDLKGRLEIVKKEEGVFAEAIQFLEKHLAEMKEHLAAAEEKKQERREKIYREEGRIKILLSEKEHEEKRCLESDQKLEGIEKKIGLGSSSIPSLEKELAEHCSELDKAAACKKEEEEKLSSFAKNLKTLEEKYAGCRSDNKKRVEEHSKALAEEKKWTSLAQENMFRLQSAQDKEKSLKDGLQKNLAQLKNWDEGIGEKQKKVSRLIEEVENLKNDVSAEQEKQKNLGAQRDACTLKIETLFKKLAEKKARLQTLLRLKEEMEGFSSGAKALLKESKKEKSPLFGKLKEFASILTRLKKGGEYDKAYESTLRFYSYTLVVESKEAKRDLLEYADKHKLTDFSLLCLEEISKDLFEHLLQKWQLSEELTHSLPSKCPALSKKGSFYDSAFVYFSEKGEESIFSREKELETLQAEVKELTAELEGYEIEKVQCMGLYEEKKKGLLQLQEAMRLKEMNLVAENFAYQREKSDYEKLSKDCAEKEKFLSKLREELDSLRKSESETAIKLAAAKEKVKSGEAEGQEAEKSMESLHAQLQALREAKDLAAKACSQISALHQKCEHEKLLTLKEIARQKGEAERLAEEKKEVALKKSKANERITEIETDVADSKRVLEDLLEGKGEEEESVKKWKQELSITQKDLEAKKDLFKTEERKRNQIEIELAKTSSLREEIEREVQATSQDDAIAVEAELSDSSIESEMAVLRAAIEKAGAVNMASIEEYSEEEKRCAFLQSQFEDLEKTKSDLEKIIATLDSECRKVFRKTFNEIKVRFQKNFKTLFGGGEADLLFTDSQDIMQAGIEITAKPPGKQMRAISLLSGGEKCLTALALLFAIFEVKPAPFCILDEVDAPLDESNIGRFTELLKSFLEKTQFLIVTHNKKTMAICDKLFGVSMEQRGVSSLMLLAFEKNREGQAMPALTQIYN